MRNWIRQSGLASLVAVLVLGATERLSGQELPPILQ